MPKSQFAESFRCNNLNELFSGKLFYVPNYQRGYAWETEHVGDLLTDLELIDDKDHYTGTIVLQLADERCFESKTGIEYSKFNIVDGQQRLTTLVILLDRVRRKVTDTDVSTEILKTYCLVKGEVSKNKEDKDVLILDLFGDTGKYFDSIIRNSAYLEGPMIKSAVRIKDAIDFIDNYLKIKELENPSEFQTWLRSLYKRITHRLNFSIYTVSDASEVGVIFEVMNNRGKKLTEMEKVKNYLLYFTSRLESADGVIDDLIVEKWGEIQTRLLDFGVADPFFEDQLLRVHWLMKYDHRSIMWNGCKSVKNTLFSIKRLFELNDADKQKLKDAIIDYTNSLYETCIAFTDIYDPNNSSAFKDYKHNCTRDFTCDLLKWSQRFRRLDVVAPFLPILVATRLKHKDASNYVDILKLCELFAFRVYRLLERRSNTGQSFLFRLGHDIYHNVDNIVEYRCKLAKSVTYYSPQDRVEAMLNLTGKGRNWYNWSGLRYFCYEYESYLATKIRVGDIFPYSHINEKPPKVSIEHVFPQNPADEYWTARKDFERLREHTHDLGNLVLTKQNPELSNSRYSTKRRKYLDPKKSTFSEVEIGSTFSRWNLKAISDRRAQIIKWAIARWAIEVNGVDNDQEVYPNDEE